jgi:hypothetical protein
MSTRATDSKQQETYSLQQSFEREGPARRSQLTGVTLFWVEGAQRPHAACASAEYVSNERLGVHLELPLPVGVTIWIVLASGSGCWGRVHACQTVADGHLAELRLITR